MKYLILYHGTNKENAESIKKNRFIINRGGGIYLTKHKSYAKTYAGRDGTVFMVKVLKSQVHKEEFEGGFDSTVLSKEERKLTDWASEYIFDGDKLRIKKVLLR